MKARLLALTTSAVSFCHAQNLVPNPGFEMVSGYMAGSHLFGCSDEWKENWGLMNPAMNTPDLQYTGGSFFTTIGAYEGIRFVGMDCSVTNPEYIQVKLSSPMIAGETYCVSFYTSKYNSTWDLPLYFVGAYFTVNQLTVNPYVAGITAHVQETASTDPAAWKLVKGLYVASGGEEYLTLGCFQGNTNLVSYTYIDQVDVHVFNTAVNLGPDQFLCPGQNTVLDAGNDATAFLWSTGETTPSINVNTAGTYWVEKFNGVCSVMDTVTIINCEDTLPPVIPEPVPVPDEGEVFVPNSFTPDGDGLNDVFAAKGENIRDFEMKIYDRWGQLIFSSVNIYTGWNGMFKGQPAPDGVYVYTVSHGRGPAKKHATGHVVLMR